MARPYSEEKRQALLQAATQLIAKHGVGVATAEIARAASVAEGTLFRYFASKDILIEELYLHLMQKIGQAVGQPAGVELSLQEQARRVWESYVDWGLAHPEDCCAISQLANSTKVSPEVQAQARQICSEALDLSHICKLPGLKDEESMEFADALWSSMAQIVLQQASRNPAATEKYKQIGFRILWTAACME